jgi:hypothetical protein
MNEKNEKFNSLIVNFFFFSISPLAGLSINNSFLLLYCKDFLTKIIHALKGCSHVEVLFSHDRKKNFFFNKKIFLEG